ncbi:MAG: MOSC domain-containing protein [Terriglobia bacterium]
MQSVGVIRQLARFPVKSMRGEALSSTMVTLQGLPWDRRYAFVQKASRRSFPWFTARELPELLRYTTTIQENGPAEGTVIVGTPRGENWPVESEELRRELEERSGRGLFLLHDHRGSYDAAPISLISRQTVARIAEESGTQEEPWRFRPNLLVELKDGEAFDELDWVGRILRIGDQVRIAITEVDVRCMMITLDPASAEATPEILRSVTRRHEQRAGIYATVLTAGEVHAGADVMFET